jgi:hypothetical protein
MSIPIEVQLREAAESLRFVSRTMIGRRGNWKTATESYLNSVIDNLGLMTKRLEHGEDLKHNANDLGKIAERLMMYVVYVETGNSLQDKGSIPDTRSFDKHFLTIAGWCEVKNLNCPEVRITRNRGSHAAKDEVTSDEAEVMVNYIIRALSEVLGKTNQMLGQ